jgi:hypothetical protein
MIKILSNIQEFIFNSVKSLNNYNSSHKKDNVTKITRHQTLKILPFYIGRELLIKVSIARFKTKWPN